MQSRLKLHQIWIWLEILSRSLVLASLTGKQNLPILTLDQFYNQSSSCQSNIKFESKISKLNIISAFLYPCIKNKYTNENHGCGVPKGQIIALDFTFQILDPEINAWDDFQVGISTKPMSVGSYLPYILPPWLNQPCRIKNQAPSGRDLLENEKSILVCPPKGRDLGFLYKLRVSLRYDGFLANLTPDYEKVVMKIPISAVRLDPKTGLVTQTERLGEIGNMVVQMLPAHDKNIAKKKFRTNSLDEDMRVCHDQKILKNETDVVEFMKRQNGGVEVVDLREIQVRNKTLKGSGTLRVEWIWFLSAARALIKIDNQKIFDIVTTV